MAFIDTIRPSQASGAAHEMYKRQQEHWGYVPNYAKVFSHRPETMARWGRLLAEIRRPVSDRLFELVTFAVATELKHSSCSLAHGQTLAGIIGESAVCAIAAGERPDVLSDAEVAAMFFARDIARDAGKISAGQVEALKTDHGFSDEEIFDIAAIASGRCFLTKILDALGSQPDSAFMSLGDELRQRLVDGGRPISQEEPEFVQIEAA